MSKTKTTEVIKATEAGFQLADQFNVLDPITNKVLGKMTVTELVAEILTVQGQAQGLAQHLHNMGVACKNTEALKRTFATIEVSQGWHSGRGKPASDSGTIPAPSLYTDYKSKLIRAAEKGVLWESKSLNEARTKTAKLEHKAKVVENAKTQAAHKEKVNAQAGKVVDIAEHPDHATGDLTELWGAVMGTVQKQFALASLDIQRGMIRDFSKLAVQYKTAQELQDQAAQTDANRAAQEASTRAQGGAAVAH